jgi:7-carboxy-7-deazaguanine synthase
MNDNHILKVSEIFTSIQGEGLFTGKPMHFVRMSGCNLGCIYCDTPEKSESFELTIGDMLEKIKDPPFFPVYITGGEPLLQESTLFLIINLFAQGREVHLDTNGSVDLNPVAPKTHLIVDIKTPGSKAGDSFLESNLNCISQTDEIKFIITSREDFDWAIRLIDKHSLLNVTSNVLVQPAWGLVDYAEAVEWILKCNYPLRLSAQLHKFIWGPQKRGV